MSQPKLYNKLDYGLLIADIFHEAMVNGITTVTTQEILSMLGIKNPDFEYENVEYDLSLLLTPDNMEKLEDGIYNSPFFNGKGEELAA